MNGRNGLRATLSVLLLLALALCFFACKTDDGGSGKGVNVLEPGDPGELVYTVSYVTNGGSEVSASTVKSGETVKQPTSPTKQGYVFKGWYTAPELFIEWDFAKDKVTSNVTLYARWELMSAIYINSDNFSFSPSTNECVIAVAATEDTADLTNKIMLAGVNNVYDIYEDEDCTKRVESEVFSLDEGDNVYYIKVSDNEHNELFVARFVIKRGRYFTVEFYDENGGKVGEKTCEEGSTLASPPEDYSLIGYDIKWYDGTSEFKFGVGGTEVHANVTLRALTSVKAYSVAFNADGGTASSLAQQVKYGERVVLPAATKSGYAFSGWFRLDGTRVSGSNGIVNSWNIDEDTTLIAHWIGNPINVGYVVELNGSTQTTDTKTVATGDSLTLGLTGGFGGTKKDGGKYTIYVFDGFYANGTQISTEKTFVTEPITIKTTITEKWFTLTIKEENLVEGAEAACQNIEFYDATGKTIKSDAFFKKGDTIKAKVTGCECGNHTFEGWNGTQDGVAETEFVLRSQDTAFTEWSAVFVTLKNLLAPSDTEISTLDTALSGGGMTQRGTKVTIKAEPQDDYTFVGWFDENDKKISDMEKFDYSFTLNKSEKFIARWADTSKIFNIEPSENVSVTVEIDKQNNVVGGKVKFVPDIKNGYIFTGLRKQGSENPVLATDGQNLYKTIEYEDISSATAYYVTEAKRQTRVNANMLDAGSILYRINDKGTYYVGTTYGGEVDLRGMTQGDFVILEAETYNGYVWLGWYKNDELYTTATRLKYEINATESDEYQATWKKAAYTVKTVSGVFSEAASTTGSGKYYVYDEEEGTFSLADKTADGTKKYYAYAHAISGGTQRIDSYKTYGDPSEYVTVTATVNDGYRFDGWYDDEDNLLTFDLSYTFSVRRLKSFYEAKYTKLENYEVTASLHTGSDTGNILEKDTAGTINYFSYKKKTDDGIKEYCKITVKTKKVEPLSSGEIRGYQYLGLYKAASDVDYNSSPLSPQSSELASFEFSYEINVSELRKSGGSENYLAVWRKPNGNSDYYRNATIVNGNAAAGDVYYMVNGTNLILVAEPKSGYVFAGWKSTTDAAGITYGFVWSMTGDGGSATFTATWATVKDDEKADMAVKYATDTPGGTYSSTALLDEDKNDNFVLQANTNDGYVFLGWYASCDDGAYEPICLAERFAFERNKKKITLSDGSSIDASKFTFEPRWKKTDAAVVTESVGESEITGYVVSEGGVNVTYYRIRTSSPIEYGTKGAAWYDGWFFDGWYDKNGEKISGDYEIIVRQDKLEGYYKAVWKKINVEVVLTTSDNSGGSTATYAYYLDETNNLHLLLVATCADGYMFTGWRDVSVPNGEIKSFDPMYDINLDKFDENISDYYAFRAIFGQVNNEIKPTAKDQGTNNNLSSPSIVGTLKEDGKTISYTVSAQALNGYVFLGWTTKSGSGVYVSRDMNYTFKTGTYTEALVAEYSTLGKASSLYSNFTLSTSKKFEDNVVYYGYYDGKETLVVEIKVDVPNGYGYKVKAKSTGSILPTKTGSVDRVNAQSAYNGVTVEFFRVSEEAKRFAEIEQSVDSVRFKEIGYYTESEGVYFENRILEAYFDDEDYTFIGWYDDDDNLIETAKQYDISAPTDDIAIEPKFGKYEIYVVNENEDAGQAYVEGYDVTVSFNVNTQIDSIVKGVGSLSSQKLDSGDKLEYPTAVLHKNVGAYMFGGWFTNKECDGDEYAFDSDINRDMTLYAKWIPMSDYGMKEENAIYADGQGKNYYVSEKQDCLFSSVATGEYTITVHNNSKQQITHVTVREYGDENYVCDFRVNGNVKATKTFTTEKSKIYVVSFIAEGSTSYINVTLTAPNPFNEVRRSPIAPYGASVTAVAVPTDYSDRTSEKEAYVFVGWYCNGELVSETETVTVSADEKYSVYAEKFEISFADYANYADESGKMEFVARWKKLTLNLITSDADAGRIDYTLKVMDDEETENAGAKYWSLAAIAATGYSFVGWYLYDKVEAKFSTDPISIDSEYSYVVYDGDDAPIVKCEWKYNTQNAIYSITYNMHTTDAVNSPYNLTSFTANGKTEILLYNPHKYYKEDETIKGYYVFEGWFTDQEYTNRVDTIVPSQYKGSVTLHAKWGKAVKNVNILTDADGSKYFYLGVYPQTKITDETFIKSLSQDNVSYDANDYRNKYRHFSSDQTRYYKISDTLCFRVDPIRWNVVTSADGGSYAVSACVIDYSEYNSKTNSTGGFYSNNWEKSKLHEIMTSLFAKTHFTETEKNFISLADMTVSNAVTTGYYADESYRWATQNNTTDYVFVPSYSEYYKFTDEYKKPVYTDYALYKKGEDGASGYWLRSWGEKENKAMYVTDDGGYATGLVTDKRGVRLAVKIDEAYCAD